MQIVELKCSVNMLTNIKSI